MGRDTGVTPENPCERFGETREYKSVYPINTEDRGDTGVQGDTGLPGTVAHAGDTGIQGDTGLSGSAGIQGNTGIQGTTGITGSTGISGINDDILIEPADNNSFAGQSTNDLNSGDTVAQWDLVCLQSDGKWDRSDANTVALYSGLLGVATEAKNDGNAMQVALPGSVIRNDAWGWTVGATLYMSETTGGITETAPVTSLSATRVIGYALTDDTILFLPDSTFITHI